MLYGIYPYIIHNLTICKNAHDISGVAGPVSVCPKDKLPQPERESFPKIVPISKARSRPPDPGRSEQNKE